MFKKMPKRERKNGTPKPMWFPPKVNKEFEAYRRKM